MFSSCIGGAVQLNVSALTFIWLFLPLFQSLPPILKGTELMKHLFSMTTGDNSPLKALQKSGKNQDIARMAGSISSVLNQQGKLTNGQKV